MVGVSTAYGSVLKGYSIRNVENHWIRSSVLVGVKFVFAGECVLLGIDFQVSKAHRDPKPI